MAKRTFKVIKPEKFEQKFQELKSKWAIKKAFHGNPKAIDALFVKTRTSINKYFRLMDKSIGIALYFEASRSILILEAYLKENNISYDQLTIEIPASDRIKVFMEYAHTFNDKVYWKNLADAYIMQNYRKIPYKIYKTLFSSNRKNRHFIMNKSERDFLKKLPTTITIYRGGAISEVESNKYGVSWTLSKKIAQEFADVKKIRDKKKMIVIEKIISKENVVAYFNDRQEEEIIYI